MGGAEDQEVFYIAVFVQSLSELQVLQQRTSASPHDTGVPVVQVVGCGGALLSERRGRRGQQWQHRRYLDCPMLSKSLGLWLYTACRRPLPRRSARFASLSMRWIGAVLDEQHRQNLSAAGFSRDSRLTR